MALTFDFDFEATKAALLYLAGKRLPAFDKYRALKLIFLADRDHLLRFGRTITGDSYSALPYGPTPNKVLELLGGLELVALEGRDPMSDEVAELVRVIEVSNLEHPTYKPKQEPDLDALSETDVVVFDGVMAEHGHKTFEELKTFTHSLKAYTNAWQPDGIGRKFPMKFEDFFAEDADRAEFLKELEEAQHLNDLFPSALELPKVMVA